MRNEPTTISSRGHLVPIMWTLMLALATVSLSPNALLPVAGADEAPKNQTKDAADWRLARGDAESSGATATKLPDQLIVLWEFKAEEAIEVTPIVVGDKVFVGDVFGRLYAINRANGKEVWQKNYDTGFMAAAAVDKGILVVGDVEGNLYGIDPNDGREIWKQTTDGEIAGAPTFFQDNVLATSNDGKLYCFETASGKPVWTYQTDDQIRCNPTIAKDRTFLGGCDGRLHVVDLKTGKAAGEPLPLGGPTGSTPAVSGDNVFVPIMDGVVLRFDWKQHKQEWSYEDPERQQEYRASAAVKDDYVIVSSQYKQIDAISIETGERKWRHTLRRRADASPVIAGDDVWIAATDGRLVRLNLKDGKQRWEFEVKGAFIAAPAIAGDQLFIADDEGIVRCLGKKVGLGKKAAK